MSVMLVLLSVLTGEISMEFRFTKLAVTRKIRRVTPFAFAHFPPVGPSGRERFHDAAGTGVLGTAMTGVLSRVSYSAACYGNLNRMTDSVQLAWSRILHTVLQTTLD